MAIENSIRLEKLKRQLESPNHRVKNQNAYATETHNDEETHR